MSPDESDEAVSPHECARKLVYKAVAAHADKWAALIRVRATPQFRDAVTQALHACLQAHLAEPYRWSSSQVRSAYLRLADYYASLARLLSDPQPGLPPFHFDPRFKELPPLLASPVVLSVRLAETLAPFGDAAYFKRLAQAARKYAEACGADRGGRPALIPFNTLCLRLAEAFENATEARATITRNEANGKWGGKFFRLIEALWPVACEVASTLNAQRPLAGPSSTEARGKQVQRLLRNSKRREPGTKH